MFFFLLCGPIPTVPWTGTGPWPGAQRPLDFRTVAVAGVTSSNPKGIQQVQKTHEWSTYKTGLKITRVFLKNGYCSEFEIVQILSCKKKSTVGGVLRSFVGRLAEVKKAGNEKEKSFVFNVYKKQ